MPGGAIMARTTEDRLPFPCGLRYARQISWLCFFQRFTSLRRVVFRKKIFLRKISNVVKNIHGGDPSMQKSKFSKFFFFFRKCYFICLNINFTWSQLYFEVHSSSVAQDFKFLSFFSLKFSILTFAVGMVIAKKSDSFRVKLWFGQFWPNLAQIWPKFGQIWPQGG